MWFCGPAAEGSGFRRNCSVGFERPSAAAWAVGDCGAGGAAAAAALGWRELSERFYGGRLLGTWRQTGKLKKRRRLRSLQL